MKHEYQDSPAATKKGPLCLLQALKGGQNNCSPPALSPSGDQQVISGHSEAGIKPKQLKKTQFFQIMRFHL